LSVVIIKKHISTVIFLSCLTIFLAIMCNFVLPSSTTSPSNEFAIKRISHNLGISPDWQALWWYMEKTVHKGMFRNQVLKELDKVGPHVIKPLKSEDYPFCETIEFQGIGDETHYPMWFCYQGNETKILEDFGTAIDD